jgi:hypothetical protein
VPERATPKRQREVSRGRSSDASREGPNEEESETIVSLEGKGPQMSRQLELPLERRGEAPMVKRSEEAPTATHGNERSGTSGLLELALSRENLQAALKRVKKNKGSPGIDGMTVEALPDHLRAHWSELREHLLSGAYRPSMVKEQLIPKSNGGMRKLGIPTVLDRFIQQALLQVLQPIFDPTFSERSYGFRPGRRAHDAVVQAQRFIQEGRRTVVDVDLEQFFDRVNHDVLMGKLAKAARCRRYWRTYCSMKWIRSSRSVVIPSCATPTIATFTCGRSERANESWGCCSGSTRGSSSESTTQKVRSPSPRAASCWATPSGTRPAAR